ncbi:MAG: hypothetical protein ABI193_01890 [Minicystis sp.]
MLTDAQMAELNEQILLVGMKWQGSVAAGSSSAPDRLAHLGKLLRDYEAALFARVDARLAAKREEAVSP